MSVSVTTAVDSPPARYSDVLAARGYEYGNHYPPHDARARELGWLVESAVEEFAKWRHPRVLPQMKVL